MNTVRQPKLGLVSVSLAGERIDLAKQFYKQGLQCLLSKGLDVNGVVTPCLTEAEVLEATRNMVSAGVDCLVYVIGTWVYAPSIVTAMQQFYLPTVIWGSPEPASFSSVGANVVHGSLDELGIRHKLVYGLPEDEDALETIRIFARAAMVLKTLKGAKFGLIGGRSIGMYPSTSDPIQIKKLFGVEIEHVDQLLLVEYAKETKDNDVLGFYERLKKEFGAIQVPEEVMFRSIRLYYGLNRIIKEREFSFVGVKCLEEVINTYASCCLAISLINDEGTVTACQSDINAAISMKILHTLTGLPTIFADVNNINKKDRVARLVNCGTMPTSLSPTSKSVDWGRQYEYMGRATGACPIFCCRPGKVTFGSLARKEGEYILQIAEGDAFLQSREVFSEVRGNWPQAFIRLACDPADFYQNLRSNHVAVGYGNITAELVEFCDLLGIRPIHNQ